MKILVLERGRECNQEHRLCVFGKDGSLMKKAEVARMGRAGLSECAGGGFRGTLAR